MESQLARVDSTVFEDRVLIVITGEIDLSNADELRAKLSAETADQTSVDMDLSRVEFMDSQGIRLLMELNQTLDSSGGQLRVAAPKDSIVGEILQLTQTNSVVTVVDSFD